MPIIGLLVSAGFVTVSLMSAERSPFYLENIMPSGIYDRTEKHRGINHPNWKGDYAGRTAKHDWIRRYFKKPKKCSKCNILGRYLIIKNNVKRWSIQWANISGKYKRNIKDYKSLCCLCHREFDIDLIGGENCGSSKLKTDDVLLIRKLYISRKHGYGYKILAKKFNVNKTTIRSVIKRITWKHVRREDAGRGGGNILERKNLTQTCV